MTTTATASKTFDMSVTLTTDNVLTVASPSGAKSCRIDLRAARRVKLNPWQSSLLSRLVDIARIDQTVAYTLTLEDLQALANVRSRVEGSEGAKVAEATTKLAATNGTVKAAYVLPAVTSDRVENQTNADVARINHLMEMSSKANKEDFYVLTYDIPDRLNKVCPNPSWAVTINARTDGAWRFPGMWALGARFNLSCWFVTESALNRPEMQRMLAHWRHHGARPRVVRFHPDEATKIREFIAEELRMELLEIHRQLIEGIAAADQRLGEAEADLQTKADAGEAVTEKEEDAILRRRDNEVRSRLNSVREKLAIAIDAAERYDISESVIDLIHGLRAARSAAVESFNASMQAKRGKEAK